MRNNNMYNGSGYFDRTAGAALNKIEGERERDEASERNAELIREIKRIADIAGFDVLGRITLRDRFTGRVFR